MSNATHGQLIRVRIAQITHRPLRKRKRKAARVSLLEPPPWLPVAVVASLSSAVEVAPRSAVAARPVAATTTATFTTRAATITIGHDPVPAGNALGLLEHGLA